MPDVQSAQLFRVSHGSGNSWIFMAFEKKVPPLGNCMKTTEIHITFRFRENPYNEIGLRRKIDG